MWLTPFGMWLTLIVRWLIPFGTLAHLDRNIQLRIEKDMIAAKEIELEKLNLKIVELDARISDLLDNTRAIN